MMKRRAESLIETVIAIVVIALAVTASLSLIRTSLTGNNVIGEKVVALNLGLEAIEAVRNIRDSNYLLYSGDADNCWNKFNIGDIDDCTDGDADEIAESTTYYLTRNFDSSAGKLLEWQLAETDSSNTGEVSLYSYDLEGDYDDDSSDDEVLIYAQSGISTGGTSLFSLVNEDPYTRTLKFVYDDLDGDGTDDVMDVTVTMEWTVQGQSKSLTLTRSIAHVY